MSDAIRMSKSMVECFTATIKFNGCPVEVIYVPRFGKKPGWVGPGFWEPGPLSTMPPEKYNSRVYSREELIQAGAKSKMEYLWMR